MTQSQPASSLMRGGMTKTRTVELNLVENVSDGIPVSASNGKDEAIDFLRDDKKEMTFGRRIALSLINMTWYNPNAAVKDEAPEALGSPASATSAHGDFERSLSQKPSLEKAWAYFEHVALYRYILEEKPKSKKNIFIRMIRKFQKGDKRMSKAEPGERDLKTKLYDPVFTPHSQLGDFGLGIGLYFSTLRAITVITLICGLMSIHNITYFASDQYLPAVYRTEEFTSMIRGSAICTRTSFVPCPTCNCSQNENERTKPNFLERNRCGEAEDPTDTSKNLTFALRNDCDGTPWQLATVNYSTVIVLLLATIGLGEYLRRQEVQFDEDEQTAQDYSIRISNPPKDANNPEEWRRFFEEHCDGAEVTVCTCAVDNDFLVRTLVERREILRNIENSMEPGALMSNLNLAYIAAKQEHERNWVGRLIAILAPGIPEYYARLVALNAKVQGLAQLEYPVTNVFLTFETETDQRQVLEKLSVGSLKANHNDKQALADPKYLFRGEFVLAISEPDEPSTIRWQDLNAKSIQKLKQQMLTAFCTLCLIAVVALVVKIANDSSTVGAAFAISGFNSLFPIFAKALTNLEAHAGEGEKQTSLYFKIALFRWVNTAIVITIITPFTSTLALEDGLIPKIYALFFAEIVTTSLIQLLDPMGHVNRHILAPRAATQDAMNSKFQGSEFELAERYTDMTKLLFLAVWYCSIYPAAFFMCSLSLLIKYFVDRFSLMRTWKRAPQLGTRVSKFSRRYFHSLACVAMAIMSSFYWSGFPFDNICENGGDIDPAYNGNFTVYPLCKEDEACNLCKDDGCSPTEVSFSNSDADYRFCSQDLLTPGRGRTFPFTAHNQPEGDEWMTDDQEILTTVFGWSSVVITAIVIIKFIWGWVDMAQSLFHSDYKAVGSDQNIPFSEVDSRNGYIPQVESPLFSYPLIACDSAKIDPELYDWTDPDRPYSYYDLSKDSQKLLSGMEVQDNVGFTRVVHWPPKKKGARTQP